MPPGDADGSGGIGKTRLALEAAWAALQHGSRWEGVYFAPLGAVTMPERVPVKTEDHGRRFECGDRWWTLAIKHR